MTRPQLTLALGRVLQMLTEGRPVAAALALKEIQREIDQTPRKRTP